MSNLVDAEEAVFSIDDLRGYIFTFLRKEPRVKCRECHDVCIWERRIVKEYMSMGTGYICIKCWFNVYYGPGCMIN